MSKLQLEVGKSYLTRDGRRVTIIGRDDDDLYPFIGILEGVEEYWSEDGSWWRRDDTCNDLISEIAADAPTELERLREQNAELREVLQMLMNYAGRRTHHLGCECGWVGHDGLSCYERITRARRALAAEKQIAAPVYAALTDASSSHQ